MVGQGEPLANQTVEEITRAAKVEIARVARLAREADKVAKKRHRGRQDDSRAFEDEVEDGAASVRGGGTIPSSTGNIWLTVTDSEIDLRHSTRKSAGSSGKASMFTARLHTMLWPL
jgi:hypothetical protein